jgi:hypothetical protein
MRPTLEPIKLWVKVQLAAKSVSESK